MASEGTNLFQSFSNAYTLGGLDLALDKLKLDYLKLTKTIAEDKRNYMAEIIGQEQENISTSEIGGIVSLVDRAAFYNGTHFNILSDKVGVFAAYAISNSIDPSVWTLQKTKDAMVSSFLAIEEEVQAPVNSGYAGVLNLIEQSSIDSQYSYNTVKRTAPFIDASSMLLGNQTQTANGILKSDTFLSSFIAKDGIVETSSVLATIDPIYDSVDLKGCSVKEVVSTILDGQLDGAGSRMSGFTELTAASPATNLEMTIEFPYALAGTYTITIDGTPYQFVSDGTWTQDDIALEFETALGAVANVVAPTADVGYPSGVYTSLNAVAPDLVVWSRTFTSLSIGEQPGASIATYGLSSVGAAATILLPTDAGGIADFDNSALEDIVAFLQSSTEWNGGAMYTADADPIGPFSDDVGSTILMAENFNRLALTITADLIVTYSFLYGAVEHQEAGVAEVTTAYASPSNKTGTITVEVLNEGSSISATIGLIEVIIDTSLVENSAILTTDLAASALSAKINTDVSEVTTTVLGSVISFDSTTIGAEYTVSTSGQSLDFAEALVRDYMLKHDTRNHMQVEDRSVPSMIKTGGLPDSDRSVIREKDVSSMIENGYLYSNTSMMWPEIEYKGKSGDITTQRNVNSVISASVDKYGVSFDPSDTEHISKGLPILTLPYFASSRAKSDRWFFLEAQGHTLTSRRAVDIVMNTLSPEEFEEHVFGDVEKSFSTIRDASLPKGFYEADSIERLLYSRPLRGPVVSFPIGVNTYPTMFTETIDMDSPTLFTTVDIGIPTKDVIEGFMLRGFLPEEARGKFSTEGFNLLFKIALNAPDELQEERFIELASFKVVTADELGHLIAQPQAAGYVFGTESPATAPVLPTGLTDVIPVNGTLTMDRLYFRNFRDSALNFSSRYVRPFIKDTRTDIAIAVRAFGLHDPASVENRCLIPIEGETTFQDKIIEELANTGYFPSDISGLIHRSSHGVSTKYKETVMNMLMEAIEINDFGDIISVRSAKTLINNYYTFAKTEYTMTERDLLVLCSPYAALTEVTSALPEAEQSTIESAMFNLCMKVFNYLRRDTVTFTHDLWEGEFASLQQLLFEEANPAAVVLPFYVFELFLYKIGYLVSPGVVGDLTVDAWLVNAQANITAESPNL